MTFDLEKEMQQLREIRTGTEDIFDGVILNVKRDTVRLPNGNHSVREVIRHVGAVCVVPVTDNGDVIVERQYRYPFDTVITEIPAGKLDSKEEDRLSAAKRELREETGLTADEWIDLGGFYSAPAYSDEYISMYMARGLHQGKQELDPDEFLDVEKVPLSELVEDVMAGRIPDAKTQTAILKAARILGM
jgi:ADP-ribose pyrophosphatase